MVNKDIYELRQLWHSMASELDFEIIAPYTINYDNKELSCFAFLPKFGSENGMVIDVISPPTYETNKEISNACKILGVYYAFINYDSYAKAGKKVFCEALLDWGYFGEPEGKPNCIDILNQ